MSPETYYLAAILGLMLAGLVIKGWRRIIPVCFIGLMLPKVGYAQSGSGDQDNDVPTLIQIRDQILAQQTMLDNYFSGYTSPNKLNDISNALYNNGTPLADIVKANRESNALTQAGVNTLTYHNNAIKNNTSDISNYSEDSLSELQDISNEIGYLGPINNALRQPDGTEWLDSIAYNTSKTRQLLNGVDSSSLLLNLDQDNDVPTLESILSQNTMMRQMISSYGQWDQDNDVPAIEQVGASVDGVASINLDTRVDMNAKHQALMVSLNGILGELQNDSSDPQAPSIDPPVLADAPDKRAAKDFVTINQENGNDLDTTVKDTLVNDAGEMYKDNPIQLELKESINGQDTIFSSTGGQKRTPVAGSYNLPTVQGSGITAAVADIDASMQLRLGQVSPIILPIITGYLLFMIGKWTLDTSNHIIAS